MIREIECTAPSPSEAAQQLEALKNLVVLYRDIGEKEKADKVEAMIRERESTAQASLREVLFVESRGLSWNGTADGLIMRLEQLGVRRGQVLGIDAHCNGHHGS